MRRIYECVERSGDQIVLKEVSLSGLRVVACRRNKAIADYLATSGYVKSLAEFQKETEMVRCLFQFNRVNVLGGFNCVDATCLCQLKTPTCVL